MKIKKDHIPKKFYKNQNSQEAFVTHVDLGTEKGTREHLFHVASASYHYYIPKHGKYVIEYVPVRHGAWHAGKVSQPNKRAKQFLGNNGPNRRTIGICYEGRPIDKNGNVSGDWSKVVDGQLANDKQVALAAELIEKHGEEKPLFAHKEITKYKPASVIDFNKRINEKLKAGIPNKERICKALRAGLEYYECDY